MRDLAVQIADDAQKPVHVIPERDFIAALGHGRTNIWPEHRPQNVRVMSGYLRPYEFAPNGDVVMGRGSYIGGSTIIGAGRRWSDWNDFSQPEPGPLETVPESSGKIRLDQRAMLKGLGMSRRDLAGKKKGIVLKQLLNEGVLLPNGQPNPDHPKVQAILRRKPK